MLSPTHLHEFKSADRITSQALVMSLYLPEQKLGSHSQPGSSSHKFILKGRQTGSMHRGHAWVFRAESHDTMLAWYEDIKNLTEKTGEARNAFVKTHVRSVSGASYRASIDSERALQEDEADETPYMANPQVLAVNTQHNANQGDTQWQQRPQPGGSFPSQVHLERGMQMSSSPSSSRSPEDQKLQSRMSILALGPPYEDYRPVQATTGPDGIPVRTRLNSNYPSEWTSPETPTLQRRHTSHEIGAHDPATPPQTSRQVYAQVPVSSASDKPASMSGEDRVLYDAVQIVPQPRPNAGPRTGSAIYIGATNGASNNMGDTNALRDRGQGQGNRQSPDCPTSESQASTRSKPSMSRTSTVSDLQLPGQFPIAQNN